VFTKAFLASMRGLMQNGNILRESKQIKTMCKQRGDVTIARISEERQKRGKELYFIYMLTVT
jgi:hypothetical protein